MRKFRVVFFNAYFDTLSPCDKPRSRKITQKCKKRPLSSISIYDSPKNPHYDYYYHVCTTTNKNFQITLSETGPFLEKISARRLFKKLDHIPCFGEFRAQTITLYPVLGFGSISRITILNHFLRISRNMVNITLCN